MLCRAGCAGAAAASDLRGAEHPNFDSTRLSFFLAKIETLSLEVDGILPDTKVFRERCFLLDGAALYSRLAVQKQNQDHKVLKMGYLKKSVLGGWGAARRQWVVLDRSELFFFAKPPEFAPDAVLA